jgi:hypothetical protein
MAKNFFVKSMDIYKSSDDKRSTAVKALYADALCHLKEFRTAARVYEELAHGASQETLLRFSIEKYLIGASLCYALLDDKNLLEIKFSDYIMLYPSFENSEGHRYIKVCLFFIFIF